MSNLPLVNVTAQINDQQGHACAGAVIKMRLCSPDKYQGLVVPREATGVTDVTGRCVLRVFPNALGYEGSIYDVHISFPGSGSGICGRNAVPAPMRPIRQKIYVPNEDCSLMDIMDLSPREPLPAGSLIPDEVAGYAARAADSAAAARSHAEAAASTLAQTSTHVARAEAAKDAAQLAESSAAAQAKRAKQLVDGVDATICNFETSVTQRVEKTAGLLTADATRCIREQQAVSVAAIEQRSGEALDEISRTASSARTEGLEAVRNAEQNAVHAVEDTREGALEDLREVGRQFEEDFLTLTERAEGAAKKSACAAAGAANSATRACQYAERAETAAQGLERHRDEALDAARRAESAGDCARADAQRAETAADSADRYAIVAKDAAEAAGKHAAAARAGATGANESARMALDAKQAVVEHRAHVDEVTADLDAAIAGAAAGMVTDRIVSDAVDAATATATDAAGRAEQSAAAAQNEAERAANAASQADGAALRAAEFAGKLEHEFNAETSVARMATELVILSDRFTKSALAGLQNELTTAQTQGQFAQLSDRVTGMEMRGAEGN